MSVFYGILDAVSFSRVYARAVSMDFNTFWDTRTISNCVPLVSMLKICYQLHILVFSSSLDHFIFVPVDLSILRTKVIYPVTAVWLKCKRRKEDCCFNLLGAWNNQNANSALKYFSGFLRPDKWVYKLISY